MAWVRYELGGHVWIGIEREPGVVFNVRGKQRRLTSAGTQAVTGPVSPHFEGPFEPFRWQPRGKRRRLSWPLGSVTVSRLASAVVWEGHAAIVEHNAVTIVAADRDRVARLALPKQIELTARVAASEQRLWLGATRGIYAVPLAELEALASGKSRDVALGLSTEYPLRRADAAIDCVFVGRLHTGESALDSAEGRIVLDLPELGLRGKSPVRLLDELVPGTWRALATSDGTIELEGLARPTELVAKLKLAVADHPDGEDRPVVARAGDDQRARIDTLIAAIGNEPDVDHHREVLLDLLQEIGDPAAPVFAELRAGGSVSEVRKKAALGVLAPYLVDVEFRAGLPITAALSRSTPRVIDAEILGDYRLGLLTELRIGSGPHEIYEALVCAPRATALRRVDATHVRTIEALRDAKRTQLTRLGHLEVWKKRNMAKLASPIFDRVTTLHAVVSLDALAMMMAAVLDDPSKAYSRVRRRLELEEVNGRQQELRRAIEPYLDRLPFEAVTVG